MRGNVHRVFTFTRAQELPPLSRAQTLAMLVCLVCCLLGALLCLVSVALLEDDNPRWLWPLIASAVCIVVAVASFCRAHGVCSRSPPRSSRSPVDAFSVSVSISPAV